MRINVAVDGKKQVFTDLLEFCLWLGSARLSQPNGTQQLSGKCTCYWPNDKAKLARWQQCGETFSS